MLIFPEGVILLSGGIALGKVCYQRAIPSSSYASSYMHKHERALNLHTIHYSTQRFQ